MAGMSPRIYERTEDLDAAGNTNAAIENLKLTLLLSPTFCPIRIVSKNEKHILKSSYGYGFSQSTGDYNVIRILHESYLSRPNKTEGVVITAGIDNKWRDIESAPLRLHEFFFKVTLNGALHWIIDDLMKPDFIYSFNIDKENVQTIAPP
ncbi:uncharacterized protein Fot_11200 [Forsythia ovata]|uniref:F-box associated beta-propeller type 1 domain-containing protein n=1 Tax=Forsythia ovata TaxID=205694 RepID=A0ABD1WJQ7_9LAMI